MSSLIKKQSSIEYLASVFLWQESINPKISFILFILGRMQLSAIIIWAQFYFSICANSSDSLTKFSHNIVSTIADSDMILGTYEIPTFELKLTLIILYMIFLLGVITSLLILFKLNRINMKIEIVYTFIGSIHNEIIYWYINLICLQYFKCPEFTFKLFGLSMTSSSPEIFLLVLLIFVINLAFCAISLVFRFDPFKTDNPMSCWVPSCQLVTGSFKTIQGLILILPSKSFVSSTFFWTVTVISVGIQKYALHNQFPFYHQVGMYVSLCLNTVNIVVVSTVVPLTLINGLNNVSPMFFIYVQMILMLVTIKAGLKTYEQQQYSAINNIISGAKCEEDVFKTMQVINLIMEKSKLTLNSESNFDSIDEFYFFSILKIHRKTCIEKACLCHSLDHSCKRGLIIQDMKSSVSDITYDILFKLFKTSAQQLKSHRVNIYLCYLELLKSRTGTRALITLFNISRKDVSFILRIGLDKLIIKLLGNLTKLYRFNNYGLLNIAEYFEYQQISTSMMDVIESAKKDYHSFWTLMKESKIKSNSILKKSISFEKKADQIDKHWAQLQSQFPKASRVYALDYARFLSTFRNSTIKALSFEKMYSEFHAKKKFDYPGQNISNNNLMDPKNVALYCLMKKGNFGEMIEASNNITRYGFSKSEILNKNVSFFLPSCIQKEHNYRLKSHIEENPNESVLYKNLSSFIKTKSGFIVPVQVYLAISPHSKDALIYLGLIREIASDKDYIILNQKCEIDGVSEHLCRKFQVKKSSRLSFNDFFESSADFDALIISSTHHKDNNLKENSSEDLNQSSSAQTQIFNLQPRNISSQLKGFTIIANAKKCVVLGTFFYSIEISYERSTSNKMISQKSLDESLEGNEKDIDEEPLKFSKTHYKRASFENDQNDFEKNDQKLLEQEMPIFSDSYQYVEDSKSDAYTIHEKKLIVGPDSVSSIRSVLSTRSLHSRIEKAIFEVPKSRSDQFYQIMILILGLLVFLALICFCMFHAVQLNSKKDIIEFSNYFEESNFLLSNIFFNVYQLEVSSYNFILANRYSNSKSNSQYLEESLQSYRNELADDLHFFLIQSNNIDDPTKKHKIPIQDLNEPYFATITFGQYMQSCLSALNRMIKASNFSNVAKRDKNFIMMNNYGIVDVTSDVVDDIFSQVHKEQNHSLTLLYVLIASSVLVCFGNSLYHILVEIRYHSYQVKLFESLRLIPSIHIESLISDADLLNQDLSKSKEKSKAKSQKKVVIISRDRRFFLRNIFFFLVMFSYILGFIILNYIIEFSESAEKVSNDIQNFESLLNLGLSVQKITPLLLQYINSRNFTYLDSKSLQSAWEENYERLLIAQESIKETTEKLGEESIIKDLFEGDLCKMLETQEICSLEAKFTQFGTYGFYSSIFNLINQLKMESDLLREIDANPMSLLSSANYINFEKMITRPVRSVQKYIMDETYNLINRLIEEENTKVKSFALGYGFYILFTTLLIRKFVLKKLNKHKEDNRKLVRMIPLKILMQNKMLKVFLREYSSKDFDQFFK